MGIWVQLQKVKNVSSETHFIPEYNGKYSDLKLMYTINLSGIKGELFCR